MSTTRISYQETAFEMAKMVAHGEPLTLDNLYEKLSGRLSQQEAAECLAEWQKRHLEPDFSDMQISTKNYTPSTSLLNHSLPAHEFEQLLALMSTTLESTENGILILSSEGQLVEWNQRFIEIMEIPDQVIKCQDEGKGIALLLQKLKNPSALIKSMELVFKYPMLRCEFEPLYFKNGKVIKRYTQPYKFNHDVMGRVWSFHDITEQHQAEQQLKKHQQELARFSRIATAAEMVSGIAHEVNQPLSIINNNIGGILERSKSMKIDAEIIQKLEETAEQVNRTGNMIHRLRNFFNHGALEKTAIDLNQCIRNLLSLIQFKLKKNNVQVKLKLNPDLPKIYADKIQIEQALLNIIQNSLEAMERQTNNEICIITDYAQNATITISDTGPGIDGSIKERIFEAFVTGKQNGMGMGLALSRSTLEAHGGALTLEASSQQGTCFKLTLPCT
jgi:nitrogen-specific signal transduction histidine kinase